MKTPVVEAHCITTEQEDIRELIDLLDKAELESDEADRKAKEARRKVNRLRSELLEATPGKVKSRTHCSETTTRVWFSTGHLDSTKKKTIYIKDIVRIRNYTTGAFAGRAEGIVLGTSRRGGQIEIGFEDSKLTTVRSPHTCTVIGHQE